MLSLAANKSTTVRGASSGGGRVPFWDSVPSAVLGDAVVQVHTNSRLRTVLRVVFMLGTILIVSGLTAVKYVTEDNLRTSLSINRLGRTDSKINFQLPASITCPCQKPVAWGQAVKFSSELVDHKFVNSTNLLDDLFLEAQCYSFWARNSTDLIAPHEYEVLGKMIQNFGAVDALNTDAVAPPPSFAAAPAPYQAAPGSPSSAAPTAPAINILENIDLGGYFTRFRPNCVAVMRALVPNNGSQYTETRDQGLTFKQNTVPGQTLKSFNDLDDAYWTLLETQSRSLQLIQSEGAAEVSKVASEVVYTLNTSDSVDNFVEYIMTDIIAAQARLHSFVDKRFALPATSLHTDMISKWAHDNVVLDWDAYAAACGFPYCDQFDKKGVAVRITEFLAVVGGLWSIILIFSAGLYSCAQRLLGLECNEYAWVPPSGAQHAAHVPGSQGIV